MKFVADPGHGGHDSGALSPRGLKESEVVLDVCLRVKHLLREERTVDLLLTRETDIFLPLTARARTANDHKADVFLSVHCNSAEVATAHGYEAFTSIGTTRSDAMATRLLGIYAKAFPALRLRADWTDGDPDKEAKFTVLTATRMPAVLLELEFIHTQFGHDFFSDLCNREKMARAIADWMLEEAKLR